MSTYRAVEAYINIRAIVHDNVSTIITVYGDHSQGKTKLLKSVESTVIKLQPEKRIKYITTFDFISELVQAVYDGKMPDYIAQCCELDLLLIDDIHDISGKIALEHELLKIINALEKEGKQIVMTMNKPLREAIHIDRNLKKKIESGVVLHLR